MQPQWANELEDRHGLPRCGFYWIPDFPRQEDESLTAGLDPGHLVPHFEHDGQSWDVRSISNMVILSDVSRELVAINETYLQLIESMNDLVHALAIIVLCYCAASIE